MEQGNTMWFRFTVVKHFPRSSSYYYPISKIHIENSVEWCVSIFS